MNKVPFKEYKKEYENVFGARPYFSFDLKNIDFDYPIKDKEEFVQGMTKLTDSFQSFMWDYSIKSLWLLKKMSYNTRNLFGEKLSSHGMPKACFKQFCFKEIGFYPETLFRGIVIKTIVDYAEELFPDIDDRDLDKDPIKYPFTYMNINCLIFVQVMDERMDLLKIGEERKMTPVAFFDYVMNYLCCYREEHEEKYLLVQTVGNDDYTFLRIIKKKYESRGKQPVEVSSFIE